MMGSDAAGPLKTELIQISGTFTHDRERFAIQRQDPEGNVFPRPPLHRPRGRIFFPTFSRGKTGFDRAGSRTRCAAKIFK